MTTVQPRQSFRDVVTRIMNFVRIEPRQERFLQALARNDVPSFQYFDLKTIFSKDKGFVLECIKVSLENENQFWSFFDYLEQLILKKELIIIDGNDDNGSMKFVYNETLNALVDKEKIALLKGIT